MTAKVQWTLVTAFSVWTLSAPSSAWSADAAPSLAKPAPPPTAATATAAPARKAPSPRRSKGVYRARTLTVLGGRRRRAKIPERAVGGKQLERFETDDIHRGLAEVPKIYVREEDGCELR